MSKVNHFKLSPTIGGRRVARQLVEIDDLKNKGELIEEVAETVPADLVNEMPLEPTVGMEVMIDEVLTYIEHANVKVIGVYGMGGVGKTTLLTNIFNSSKHILLPFNYVLWVTVSRELKLDNIQDKIARDVGLISDKWKDQSQQEKARDIFSLLHNKIILLLLDDIWDRIALFKLGIPISDCSKLLFSTRSEDVCRRMAVQKKIKVQCLEWSEALFPEDYGIARDELLDCWMCEELLEYPNMEEARNETYYIIGILLNACLLEEMEVGVKMHVIRDMTLWLTSDPSESFLVQTGAQLVKVPILVKWEKSKNILFSVNCLKDLAETPTCPNLLTLFLRGNELRWIGKEFLDFMPVLVVLDLSENISLKMLSSRVSKLVALQQLNLSKTHLQELPDELKLLVKLLVLNLEDTPNLKFIPPNKISSLLRTCHS